MWIGNAVERLTASTTHTIFGIGSEVFIERQIQQSP